MICRREGIRHMSSSFACTLHRTATIAIVVGWVAVLVGLIGCSAGASAYRDGRPAAWLRLPARDEGVILRHGDGPDSCDAFGARDVFVFQDSGTFFMHYDGSGPRGWLCCLAESKDLRRWAKVGPVLALGADDAEDARSASFGTTINDGVSWHMFYLGTRNVSPAPDLVPTPPYVTMKAQSASPRGPWLKQPDVTPFRCTPGTYYSDVASPGHVVRMGGQWLQFFSAATRVEGALRRTLGIARTSSLDSSWDVDSTPIVPITEQIENSSVYFETSNQTWFLFTNHVGISDDEYTDAIWVYWTKDLNVWDAEAKAVVLDGLSSAWSRRVIGLPSVLRVGDRLAIFYDGLASDGVGHMRRDIGLAWLDLPLRPPPSDAAGGDH